MTDDIVKPSAFVAPPCARQHCRHYSYVRGGKSWDDPENGPRCGVGLDLSAPGAGRCCWPDPATVCERREEWSEAERAVWESYVADGRLRLIAGIAAVPAPIPLNTSGSIDCPNCTGTLHYARWPRGAELVCSTANCLGARFNIAPGADWPDPAIRAARVAA